MKLALLALLVLLGACKGAEQAPPPATHEGHAPAPVAAAVPVAAPAPRPMMECAPESGAELVYVVTHDRELYSFDPSKLGGPDDPFQLIGRLGCDLTRSPFSMAVDRHGVAWVDYSDGALYRVSILDAHCEAVKRPPDAPRTFGMAFARDGPREMLYVADEHSEAIGKIVTDDEPVGYYPVTQLQLAHKRSPELCGTGDGKLWAYFPEEDGGFIQELELGTGLGVGPRMPVTDTAGHIGSWAFAQWSGTFYVFAAAPNQNSMLYAVRRRDGERRVVRSVPFRVVGAGVSTCAPMLEKAN